MNKDDILMQIDREIDELKRQRGNPSEWTLVLSPEYYARFLNECTRFTPDDDLITGVVMYHGMSVVKSNFVPGVGMKLQKKGMDLFEQNFRDMLHAPGMSREELDEINRRIRILALVEGGNK